MSSSLPFDYDSNPARWEAARRCRSCQLAGDVHQLVGARFSVERLSPVIDVGSGRGELQRHLSRSVAWIGIDRSVTELASAPRPVVRGDAIALPLRDESAGAVAALWMLYHLDEPLAAIRECFRVLRSGGLLAASATSRADSPELAHLLDRRPSPFEAEEAPALLGSCFPDVEVVRWDGPLVRLTTREAVHDYLVGRLADLSTAWEAAGTVPVPLDVMKRGRVVFARKR